MTDDRSEATENSDDTEFFDEIKRATDAFNERDFSAAVDICEKALKQRPGRAEPHFVLGIIAFELGNQGRAITFLDKAHELDPNTRDYADALASMHTRAGNLTDGLYYAKLALTLEPHPHFKPFLPAPLADYFSALKGAQPSTHFLEAARLFNQRRYAEAIDAAAAEMAINKDHAECTRLLGRSFHKMGNYERAVAALHAAIHMMPDDPLCYVYLGDSLIKSGRHAEAFACHEKARALAPDDPSVHAATTAALTFQPEGTWSDYRKRAAKWQKATVKTDQPAAKADADELNKRKVRIGYLSNAFFQHPELIFVEPLLKYHDRNRFEVHCYQHFVTKDTVTTRLEGYAGSWRNLYDIDPLTASFMLKGDGLDILVDLTGLADDHTLEMLAEKAVPVQIAWLGSPEAAATPGIDVVLSDDVAARHDKKMCLKGQEIEVLEHGLVALDPFVFLPEPSEPPVKANGCVTFGGVCDLARLTPAVASVWSDALKSVPDSRLLLGYVEAIPPAVHNTAVEMFAHFGLTDRVQVQEAGGSDDGHAGANIEFFSSIDIMLDTFPVGATHETCEALWMGVPVVTLAGSRRTGLVGASILHAAGKADWVGSTQKKFIKIASTLAKDSAALQSLRADLRDEVRASALFDGPAFVRSVEKAYTAILEK